MHGLLIVLPKSRVDEFSELELTMPIHSFTEYSENYSKISESLWKYCMVDDVPIAKATINPETFKLKKKGLQEALMHRELIKIITKLHRPDI